MSFSRRFLRTIFAKFESNFRLKFTLDWKIRTINDEWNVNDDDHLISIHMIDWFCKSFHCFLLVCAHRSRLLRQSLRSFRVFYCLNVGRVWKYNIDIFDCQSPHHVPVNYMQNSLQKHVTHKTPDRFGRFNMSIQLVSGCSRCCSTKTTTLLPPIIVLTDDYHDHDDIR